MMGISAISLVRPRLRQPISAIAEAEAIGGADRAQLESLGIDEIRCEPRMSGVELGIAAAKSALRDAECRSEDLGLILLCQGRSPERLMCSEATRIQHELGATKAMTFTISDLGCVSSSAACQLACHLPSDGPVLIVMGSTPTGQRRFRRGVTVIGDGGGAAVLKAGSDRCQVLATELAVNGRFWDLFSVDFRGLPPADWEEVCHDPQRYSFELAAESRARFKALNAGVLSRAGLSFEQVDHVIMQNISAGAFQFYESALGLRFADSCRSNLSRYGHLGPLDIFINLQEGLASGAFRPGEHVLLMNNSPVAAWGSMLIRI